MPARLVARVRSDATSASCSTSTSTRSPARAGGRDVVEQQLRAATGLDLQKDVIDWMGDFGVFVRGASVASSTARSMIETSDEAASARFIAALERLREDARVRASCGSAR